MAERNYTMLLDNVNEKVVQWTGLLNGDTGKPYIFGGHYPDKSVQVFGTFGVSPHCYFKGTNEKDTPAHFNTLNDQAGAALDVTAEKIKQVLENTYQVRPETAGDGTLNLTVILHISRK